MLCPADPGLFRVPGTGSVRAGACAGRHAVHMHIYPNHRNLQHEDNLLDHGSMFEFQLFDRYQAEAS